MIRLLAFIFVLLSWPAVAQDIYPALHDVTGVAADDVLNVRAEPSAGSQIIGTFAPFETDIEVIALSRNGGWGRVNAGEQAGWTAMRFLARQPGQDAADWNEGLAPMTLECFGTEPFWRLTLRPDATLDFGALNMGDGTPEPGGHTVIGSSASTNKRGFFGWLDGEPIGFTGIITTGLCSDGMSDRDYGFAIDLILSDTTGDSLAAGCCSLAR